MVTALIYTRVSKEDQAREGLSLDAQLATCRQYVAAKAAEGWVVGNHYRDIMTGRRPSRPGYQGMLADVERLRGEGRKVVVVTARLDRLGRRLLEHIRARERLRDLGVAAHFVREGGELDDLNANILGSVAQAEADKTSQRVKEIRQHMIERGWQPPGRLAWGYRLRDATREERLAGAAQRVHEVDPLAAPRVREAFTRFAEGQSLRKIAMWIKTLPAAERGEHRDDDGKVIPARRLDYQRVASMLRSPTYVARFPRDDGGDVLEGAVQLWPALIDDDLWGRVQAALATHRRMGRQATGRYLLTGLLTCPVCAKRLTGWPNSKGRAPRYRCVGGPHGTCSYSATGGPIERAALDEVAAIIERVASPEPRVGAALRRSWERLRHPDDEGELRRRRDIKRLEKVVDDGRQELVEIVRLLGRGVIDQEAYDATHEVIQGELTAATEELGRLRAASADVPELPDLDAVVAMAGGWADMLAGEDVVASRAVLAELITTIVPERIMRNRYNVRIAWTPLGEALRRLAGRDAAA